MTRTQISISNPYIQILSFSAWRLFGFVCICFFVHLFMYTYRCKCMIVNFNIFCVLITIEQLKVLVCHTYYDTSHLFLWRPVTFDITVKWLKVLVERQWLTSVNHLINQTSCEKFGCFNVLVLPWPGFSMKKLWQSTPRWQRALSKGYTCTIDLLFDSWAVP